MFKKRRRTQQQLMLQLWQKPREPITAAPSATSTSVLPQQNNLYPPSEDVWEEIGYRSTRRRTR